MKGDEAEMFSAIFKGETKMERKGAKGDGERGRGLR